jgi:hypothetical protein
MSLLLWGAAVGYKSIPKVTLLKAQKNSLLFAFGSIVFCFFLSIPSIWYQIVTEGQRQKESES